MRLPTMTFAMGLFALVALACSTEDGDADSSGADVTATGDTGALLVSDPSTLTDLEKRGLSLSTILGVRGTSGKALLDSKVYKAVADTIKSDLKDLHDGDSKSGVGFSFDHRIFDSKWLGSDESRFELVGVTSRVDRTDDADCGEFRLIYRFAYTAKKTHGRLPLTMSLVFPQPKDNDQCATVAKSWLSVKDSLAASLLDGPLKGHATFSQIELNYQSAHWSSDARADFGGESDYILRVFTVNGDKVTPAPLENTPRTDLSKADRDDLRTWIQANLAAIDQGTALVPDKFLATKAVSTGPHGISRLANRPFSQLFTDADKSFHDLPLNKTKQLGSPEALLRRLDTMSCQGCHQARSVAGFHLPGEERDDKERVNMLAVGRSPHLLDELPWRLQALTAIAKKQPFDVPRPFAERGANDATAGTHCGLGDAGFRSWTCPSGLRCLDTDGDLVGVCAPKTPGAGGVCVVGEITLDADLHADTIKKKQTSKCGDGTGCQDGAGFPSGLCEGVCTKLGKTDGQAICAGVPIKDDNLRCLEKDLRPFQDCLVATAVPGLVAKCDEKNPCRDDYACMRVVDGPADTGACLPPYFVFQTRVDGQMFDD